MSFYNLIYGPSDRKLAVMVSPLLPLRPEEFPRYRDVFLYADDYPGHGDVFVYTRMGGGNRPCWEKGAEGCTCYACRANKIEEIEYRISSADKVPSDFVGIGVYSPKTSEGEEK